jgi:putative transposase
MSRQRRNLAANQPNHIVTRGNNRRRLFSYPRDYLLFLWLLTRGLERTECELHALCVMANHIHLLLTPPSVEAASECMKLVNQAYAQRRNLMRAGSGKLFEQRFWSKPIESERQLAVATAYIDANPLRAGIAEDAADYRWSTYRTHVGRPAPDLEHVPVTTSHWYQAIGATDAERAEAYGVLFARYLAEGVQPDYKDELARIEARSVGSYTRRLRRPNGTRASEPSRPRFGA